MTNMPFFTKKLKFERGNRRKWEENPITIERLFTGVFYQPVYVYRYPAVTVYCSGINGILLFTARIQNPNQNGLYKRYAEVYRETIYTALVRIKPLQIASKPCKKRVSGLKEMKI
jgi:hypothetical protein